MECWNNFCPLQSSQTPMTTHIATREIILTYFDILSIVELGMEHLERQGQIRLFLFLKSKTQRPEPARVYF